MFMFTEWSSALNCFDYHTDVYYPKFVLKNNKTLISEAEAVAKMANDRLAQLKQEVIDAKKLLSKKNPK